MGPRLKGALARFREPLIVLGAALSSLLFHARFRMSGFGELDQARMGCDVLVWHVKGSVGLDDFAYRLRTSALYLRWLKFELDHGLAIRQLPALMNWYAIVMSSVCSVALFYLFRRLVDWRIAAGAVAVHLLTPGFFMCSIYGMPTVAALAFLVCAALAFSYAVEASRETRKRAWLLLLSAFLCWLSFTNKADLAMSSAALLLVPLHQLEPFGKDRRRALRVLLMAVAVVGVATLGTLGFSHAVSAGQGADLSNAEFASKWNQHWPMSFDNLLDPQNNGTVTHTTGTLWFAVSVVALFQGLLSPGPRRIRTLLLAAWALPSLVYWTLITGNIARHNVPGATALIFLAVLFLADAVQTPKRSYVLCALVSLFSLLDTSGTSEVTPAFNFVKTRNDLEEKTSRAHHVIRSFLQRPGQKKALIDSTYNTAYDLYEAFASAAHNPPFRYDAAKLELRDARGTVIHYVEVPIASYEDANRHAAELKRSGWQVCTGYFQFCDGT